MPEGKRLKYEHMQSLGTDGQRQPHGTCTHPAVAADQSKATWDNHVPTSVQSKNPQILQD